jgi:hypothetical protein
MEKFAFVVFSVGVFLVMLNTKADRRHEIEMADRGLCRERDEWVACSRNCKEDLVGLGGEHGTN